MNWNPLTWFAAAVSSPPTADALHDYASTLQADAEAVLQAAPARAVTIFDAMLEALRVRSAGHPLLIEAETWIQAEIDAHGAALLVDAEAAVLRVLAGEYPPIAALLPVLVLGGVQLPAVAVATPAAAPAPIVVTTTTVVPPATAPK
jgi:hypothetical protein